eukprot:scaffold142_cov188-Ochromonas_danica.AAC.4
MALYLEEIWVLDIIAILGDEVLDPHHEVLSGQSQSVWGEGLTGTVTGTVTVRETSRQSELSDEKRRQKRIAEGKM